MLHVEAKTLIKKLNPYCTNALEGAIGLCMQSNHAEISILHWLDKLLRDQDADLTRLLARVSVDASLFHAMLRRELAALPKSNGGKPTFAPELLDWIQEAWLLSSLSLNEASIRSGALFLALLPRSRLALGGTPLQLLANVSVSNTQKYFFDEAQKSIEAVPGAEDQTGRGESESSALKQFGEDLTAAVRAHQVDPVFGREHEIRQMIDILCRRRKNNPILVGEAGVGKTALVEGLALKIVQKEVPDMLADVRLITLDLGLMEAGASVKGEFERRLKAILQEVETSPTPIILFIDEAHLLMAGGQGGHDAANLLKPALARGKIRIIAATTWSEYKKHIEKDPALTRRFQRIPVGEPNAEETLTILRGLRTIFEASHEVMIRDDALQMCERLSTRYLTDRQQPDKAIDVMDTACARVRVNLKARPTQLVLLEEKLHALENEVSGLMKDKSMGVPPDETRLIPISR